MPNTVRFSPLRFSSPTCFGQSKKMEATTCQVTLSRWRFLRKPAQHASAFRDFRVIGREDDKITVRVKPKTRRRPRNQSSLPALRSFRRTEHFRRPKNDVQITVEIPRSTVFVRMPAGQLELTTSR